MKKFLNRFLLIPLLIASFTLPSYAQQVVPYGGIVAGVTASNLPSAINATKIANGTVDNTEFQYLNGVTSAIQTQINTKAPTATPTFSGLITNGGGQIAFPATQNPSANVNTLDDYEEGAWTPIDSSGAGLSFTITGTPSYIKIGTMVYCFGTITFPVTASGAAISIGGLPFTAKSNGGGGEVGSVQVGYNNIAANTIAGLVNQNATTFKLFMTGSTVITNVTASAKVFVFTIIYPAAN